MIEESRGIVPLVESCKTVKEYWDPESGWNWNLLRGFITPAQASLLSACLLRNDETHSDGICWGPSKSGQFTTISAYNLAKETKAQPTNDTWRQI